VARSVWPHQGPEHRLYIAEYLTAVGIDLKEVRVAGDEEKAIIDALNALRHRCTYVFTTGGIGPTHGDISTISELPISSNYGTRG
jgi:molybdopterin-biosynthesis enzyme MoeA-like protein